MKKNRLILSIIFLALLLVTESKNEIVTKQIIYMHSNQEIVTTREIAMLAALSYEDVPNEAKYETNTNDACIVNGILKKGCFFTEKEQLVKIKNSKYSAYQYIEGMSDRKMNSVLLKLSSSTIGGIKLREDGQKYYFHNYADVKELQGSWVIYDYKTTHDSRRSNDDINKLNDFNAITFKKGNNYVIAYRGTDAEDILEWKDSNGAYFASGENEQAYLAYDYAQQQYLKIIKENSNAHFYVTGHSLGGYLAQVGGAAIVDLEAGYCNNTISDKTYCKNNQGPGVRKSKAYNTLEEYEKDYSNYKKENSRLEQVAYFNGMGVTAGLKAKEFNTNIDNALVYLSTYYKNGKQSTSGRYVNYSSYEKTKVQSSGRLVLYMVKDDIVASLGFHYGEILMIDYTPDSISYHLNNHTYDLGQLVEMPDTILESIKLRKEYEQYTIDDAVLLSEKTYSIIEGEENKQSEVAPIAAFTQSIIKEEYNLESQNYDYVISLISSGKKIFNSFTDFKKKYDSSLSEYFNITHELDNFACLIDGENGIIKEDNINLSIIGINMDGLNGNYSLNKKYTEPNNYTIGNGIDYTDKENSFIVLKVDVIGGCATSYEYQYSMNETNWKTIATTYRNEIIVPWNILNIKEGEQLNYKFRVVVKYGKKFYEEKLKKDKLNVFDYEKSGSEYSVNPTIGETYMVNNNLNVKSKAKSLSLSYFKNNKNILVESNKIKCIGNSNSYSCYTNKNISEINDIKVSLSNIDKNKQYSITSKELKDYKQLFVNSEAILDTSIINIDENTTKTIEYIIDDSNGNKESLVINFIYDTVGPICNFSVDYDTIKLEKNKILTYKEKTVYESIKCTDELSGFNYDNDIDIDKISIKEKSILSGLLKEPNLDTVKQIYTDNKKISFIIPFVAKRVKDTPSIIQYKGVVKDLAGNESNSDYEMEIAIVKAD